MPHQNVGGERCPDAAGDGKMKKVLSAFYYCIYTRVLFLYEINFNFNNFRAKKKSLKPL